MKWPALSRAIRAARFSLRIAIMARVYVRFCPVCLPETESSAVAPRSNSAPAGALISTAHSIWFAVPVICSLLTRESGAALDMPRMGGHTGIGQTEERLHLHLCNFQTVTVLRLHVHNNPANGGTHGFLLVKAEDRRLDIAREKEKGPACQVDVLFKFGSRAGDYGPAARIGRAPERKSFRQCRAFVDKNGSRCDYVHT